MNIKTPANPRDRNDWAMGKLPGSPAQYKYKYCLQGPETLATIAQTTALFVVLNQNVAVSATLTWKDIARFNFGTDHPAEINYYLKWFNGCTHADPSGKNFALDKGDAAPFLYLPVVPITGASNVNVPPQQSANVNLPPPATELTQVALRRFDDLDASKSGCIKRSDVVKAMFDKSFTGVDGAMLATLYSKLDVIQWLHMDDWLQPKGITRADLAAIDQSQAGAIDPNVNGIVWNYVNNRDAIHAAGSALYVGTVDPLATKQGRTGDCWLMAAIAALGASRADGIVRNAIQAVGEKYVVTFPGGSSPITIAAPTDAFIALFGSTQGNGQWLTVLELALGSTYDASDPIAGFNSIWENIVHGGLGSGIQLMTGHDTDVDLLVRPVTTMDETRYKLEKAFLNDKCVTAGIRGSYAVWEDQPTMNGWPMAHAYSVLDYAKTTDLITVRNPWGEERNGKTIAFADFSSTWSTIAYEQ